MIVIIFVLLFLLIVSAAANIWLMGLRKRRSAIRSWAGPIRKQSGIWRCRMSDRPCKDCIWHGSEGCWKWDCEPLTRKDAKIKLALASWISVKDRVPDHYGRVLICLKSAVRPGSYYVNFGSYDNGEWMEDNGVLEVYASQRVTHWMELPKPPEVEA